MVLDSEEQRQMLTTVLQIATVQGPENARKLAALADAINAAPVATPPDSGAGAVDT